MSQVAKCCRTRIFAAKVAEIGRKGPEMCPNRNRIGGYCVRCEYVGPRSSQATASARKEKITVVRKVKVGHERS